MHELAERLLAHDFEGAIFDFDGTIAFTSHIWEEVDRAFLGSRGIEYTTEYANKLATLGFGPGAQYTIDTYGLSETVEEVCDEWKREGYARYRHEVCLRDDVVSFVEALKGQGVVCGLATNNEPVLVENLEHADVCSLFEKRVYGYEVGGKKDTPDIYLEAARRMGCEPERCVVFEDLMDGIVAASSAGFATCSVHAKDLAQDWDAMVGAADYAIMRWDELL